MKSILFLLILIAMLNSCENCKDEYYTYISLDDKLVYKEGAKLIYKSNKNTVDTIKVKQIGSNFLFNSWGGSCASKGFYQEVFMVSFSSQFSNNGNTYIHYSARDFSFDIEWASSYFRGYLNKSPLISKTINGKEYNQVYEFIKDTSKITNDKISKLYFDKKYGIICWQLKDSTIWELQ